MIIIKKTIRFLYQKIKLKITNKDSIIKSSIPIKLKLGRYVIIENSVDIHSSLSYIGDGTYIGKNSYIYHCGKIGKYCSIARDVGIGVGNHPIDFVYTTPLFYKKERKLVKKSTYDYTNNDDKVIIGNDVWIGTKAIILNGVKIGDGAIIGAGAVVTKDVEPYAIVAGVPAKTIKYRFNNDLINKLTNDNISNLDIDIVYKNIDSINNIELFINKLNK